MTTPPAAPTGRIVLFGATGYTGDLTARALVAAGVRPVLAGRSADRLRALAASLGPSIDGDLLETATADVTRPETVRGLVGRGDVLVTTVGPFARWGTAALDAAVEAGAHYVDSTGEGAFIRTLVEQGGPRAADAGSVLLTAFGYDYVPGNLAAALALQRAAGVPVAVDVAYFMTGAAGAGGVSGGTRASAAGMVAEAGYTLRGGQLVPQRPGHELWRADAGGRRRSVVTVPATEQFFVPRLAPTVRDVRVGLGWFGPLTPGLAAASRLAGAVDRVPPLRAGLGRVLSPLVRRVAGGSSGGPDEAARARTASLVTADVRDGSGERLAHVELVGPNGYTLTADLLAWAARALAGLVPGVGPAASAGALGPVDAFGLDTLQAACAAAGLVEARQALPVASAQAADIEGTA